MTEMQTLEQTLIEQLRAEATLQDIQFEHAWQTQKGLLAQGITAWIKLSPVSFVPASLGAEMCRAEFTIFIWIVAERGLGASACVDAFTRISDALLFGENGLCLQTISCGKVEYSAVAEGFQMESQVGMTGYCREGGAAGAGASTEKAADLG